MANSYHQERSLVPPIPQGCPINSDWSPLSPEYLDDPFTISAELAKDPVFYAQSLNYLVVNDMDLVQSIFLDHETFASTNVQDPVFPLCPAASEQLALPDFDPVAVMSNRPEPDHGRIRQFTKSLFSNRRLRELEPYIRSRSHELIDEMLAAGTTAEFISAFAYPLPGEVVFRFIGFPESDDAQLKDWCRERKAFSWGKPSEDQQVKIAKDIVAYWRYCRDFTASKKENPGQDLASELIANWRDNPDKLTYREVESIVYGISFAGHEPVTAALGNALLCLLPDRTQWEELVADPSLIPNAVEEVMRYESSQISWRRVTTVNTTLGGFEIPAGTSVFLNFAAANFSSELFDEPFRFDIHRQNANRNISFGKGVHFCLGSRYAKFEIKVMLEVLVERIPSLRLIEGQTLQRFPNITFRGPEELLVAWG